MTKVNVASLKSRLSEYLEVVKQGEEVVVTSHGEEIARLVPYENKNIKPTHWSEYLKTHRPLKPLKKGISSGQLIRAIRDEE